MSRLLLGAQTDRADVMASLRKHLPDLSLVELRGHLAAGTPFLERLYPMNDREDVAALFRAVIATLKSHQVDPIAYVIDDDEEEFDLSRSASFREPVEILENVLRRAEDIHEDFERLEKEGHGW